MSLCVCSLWPAALYMQVGPMHAWFIFLSTYLTQGLRASSLQFTSPLEFNAIFRDGFPLRVDLNGWSKIRNPVTAKFKHVRLLQLVCYYVVMTSRTCRRCEISKKPTWNPALTEKIHHFFFSHTWATRFRYMPEGCPYMLMYSALHIMQWFSGCLGVFTPKIRRKFFDFNIFMNQNKRRLHKIWNDR